MRSIQTNPMIFMSDRLSVAFFFSRRGAFYSPPAKQAVVSLPLVRLVRSSRTVFQTVLQRGAGNVASEHSLCSRLYICSIKEYLCVRNGEERGFTAAEFKAAQADGWEKQYPYKVGRKKVYMPPSEAEKHGYERANKHPSIRG